MARSEQSDATGTATPAAASPAQAKKQAAPTPPLLKLSYALLLALGVVSSLTPVPVSVNLIASSFLIIFIGSYRSLTGEEENPAMSQQEAWLFPVVGSCVLFSLYLAFKLLGRDTVNLLLGLYFAAIAVFVVMQTLSPLVAVVVPSKRNVVDIDVKMPCQAFSKRFLAERFVLKLTAADIVAGVLGTALSVWHYRARHFVSNNILGTAFAVQGVEHIAIGTYANGAIVLIGLFFYDVFWVFATDVMVTVARSFDAPIKLLFLRAHATADTDAQFSMLGLGDIVIPGIFIALLLRFDRHLAAKRRGLKELPPGADFTAFYFNACSIGYVLGLATTLFVMYTWQAAQPALLYLSPACLLFSLVPALVRGDFRALWAYNDEPEDEKKDDGDNSGETQASTDDSQDSGAKQTVDSKDPSQQLRRRK